MQHQPQYYDDEPEQEQQQLVDRAGQQNEDEPQPFCRDFIWAVAFVAQLAVICVLAGFGFKDWYGSGSHKTLDSVSLTSAEIKYAGYGGIFALSAIAIFTILWLFIMFQCTGALIKSLLILQLVLFGAGAIAAFTYNIVLGVIMAVLWVLALLFVMWAWRRIPFSEAMLKTSLVVLKTYPGPVYVAFNFLFIQVILVFVYFLAFGAVGNNYAVLLAFSAFWTFYVVINIVHMTACGVLGTWYYNPGAPSPTWNSYKRAQTSSFGTICFASAVIAFIRAIEFAIIEARKRADNACAQVVLCCLQCLVSCIGDIVEYLNSYALAQAALHGTDFCESARQILQVFRSRGWDAIINDDLTYLPIWFGSLLCAAVGVLSFVGYTYANGLKASDSVIFIYVLVFMIGIAMHLTVMQCVISYIKTLFLCWAQDPQQFPNAHPNEYRRLYDAFVKMGYEMQLPPPKDNNNYQSNV